MLKLANRTKIREKFRNFVRPKEMLAKQIKGSAVCLENY